MVANEFRQMKSKAYELHSRYEKYYPAAFFVGGFIFDVFTLGRIDSLASIIQQAVYIIFIGYALVYQTLEKMGIFKPTELTGFFGRQFQKLWHYENEALHFIFGSLLSSYFLFYFVSSSLAVSSGFLVVMFGLLVANEFPEFQKKGPWLKFTLYAICVFSFFSYLVPVAVGFTNVFTLIVALCIGLLMVYSIFRFFEKKAPQSPINLQKNILRPPMTVAAVLLLLYFLKLLPPLPLSIQYMGVYHAIQKEGSQYVLKYDRPWYRFWQNGAQTFLAQPGDKIVCFARIFSPTDFADQVVFHWEKHGPNGWEDRDHIRNSISGGRDDGFRGYSVKNNYELGDWRVKVETLDGREIGRVSFTVVLEDPALAATREFKEDRY